MAPSKRYTLGRIARALESADIAPHQRRAVLAALDTAQAKMGRPSASPAAKPSPNPARVLLVMLQGSIQIRSEILRGVGRLSKKGILTEEQVEAFRTLGKLSGEVLEAIRDRLYFHAALSSAKLSDETPFQDLLVHLSAELGPHSEEK